jgi:hypothetical protein
MLDEKLERLRTHQAGIERYRRLLATRLSDLERAYIERRLSEHQASMRALLRDMFPDRLTARLSRIKGRTKNLGMAALLHPGDAFGHPMDVVDDCDLTSYEKRAILSTWAAEACAVPEQTPPDRATAASLDVILDALRLLESEPELKGDHLRESGGHSGAQRPGHSYF